MKWQAAVAILVAWSTAYAQPAALPAESEPPRPTICLIGSTDCKAIALLEATVAMRTPVMGVATDLGMEFAAGGLVNVWPRHAVGASFGVRSIDFGYVWGFVARARYRYWLTRSIGLDASVGPILGDATGATVQVGIDLKNQIALVVDMDAAGFRDRVEKPGTSVVQLGVGVRFGGYVAPALAGLYALNPN